MFREKNHFIITVLVFLFVLPSYAEQIELKVRPGDTLSLLLEKAKIHNASKVAAEIDRASRKEIRRQLQPGKPIKLEIDSERSLKLIQFAKDYSADILVARMSESWSYREIKRELQERVSFFSGKITKKLNSIYLVAKEAEYPLSDEMIDAMAEILGWQIDFRTEVRVGDHFQIYYTQLFYKGKRMSDGRLLAVEFVNFANSSKQKRIIKAINFEQNGQDNYFDDEGNSVQKAFLRYPVRFSRISSRFSKRFHPILKRWRSHKGLDLAAPRGTPVFAAGDGRIVERKRARGYGKYITISHNQNIKTRYAHLHGFSSRSAVGTYVKKGTIIGYVGSTGLSSGPHLHYEWIKNGRQSNPLLAKIPNALSVGDAYKKEFNCVRDYWNGMFVSLVKKLVVIVNSKPLQCMS